ncbi:hypothetical protein OBBRIDRAFT_798064 [Obba rivulosa]|uniref:Uncharacterized protein n=1 Tax=Obba rivulosa TaxID=1052685 RepID=A0A8E2DF29_9APHY|nr:hypothetical protein OBBRIDRAFT_798064 [Obba rivulosa]
MSALFQNCFYIGNEFNAILYGVELVLYYLTLKHLVSHEGRQNTKHEKFLIGFSTALLILITIFMATDAVFGEELWVVNQNFPGGTEAWFGLNVSVWYQTMGTASVVALNWLADGLMIYRCFIIWSSFLSIIIPSIIFLGTIALGILELWASGAPGTDFFAGKAQQIGLAYFSTTIGLEFIVTTLIVIRITTQARHIQDVLGRSVARTYTSTAALVVESALPLTLSGIAYVVPLGLNSDVTALTGAIYVMFACISPQLLILRVLSGRVWTREISTSPTIGFTGNTSTQVNENSDIALQDMFARNGTKGSASKQSIFVSTAPVPDDKYV